MRLAKHGSLKNQKLTRLGFKNHVDLLVTDDDGVLLDRWYIPDELRRAVESKVGKGREFVRSYGAEFVCVVFAEDGAETMAGDWIPARLDLHEDPAIIGIAHAVSLDRFSVVGRLLRLWGWASAQTRDGWMPFCVPEDVDRVAERAGIAAAMVKVGWLELPSEGGVRFINFDRWLGESAKKRLDAVLRKRKSRVNVTKNCDKNVTPVLCPSEINSELETAARCSKPALFALPPNLDTEAFKSALADWERYCGENDRPLAPTGRRELIVELAKMGSARAVAALRHSMAMGWKGVFESKNGKGGDGRIVLNNYVPTVPPTPEERKNLPKMGERLNRSPK